MDKQGQHECMTRYLMWYDRDSAEEIFKNLVVFINKCSYTILHPRFETIYGENGRFFDFWDRNLEKDCDIIFAGRNSTDMSLELAVKEGYNHCHVRRVDPIGHSDIPLRLTLEAETEQDSGSVDVQTLTTIIIKSDFIEALHLDDSIPYVDFWKHFRGQDLSENFPVCQITMTLVRPKTRNDLTDFWNFVAVFLIDLRITLVSSRRVSDDRIIVQFYNSKHRNCRV